MLLKKYKILFYNRTISFILVQHYTGRTPKRRFLLLALSHHFNTVVHSLILNLFLLKTTTTEPRCAPLLPPKRPQRQRHVFFISFSSTLHPPYSSSSFSSSSLAIIPSSWFFFPFAPKLRKFFGHTKNSQVFVRRSKLVAFFSTLIFLLAFIFCFYACFCCCYVCDRSFLGDRLRCISVSSSPKNGGQASRSEVFFLVLAIFGYLL